jgi:hypothetical protein
METLNKRGNEGAPIKPVTTQICPIQTTHRKTGFRIRVLLIGVITSTNVTFMIYVYVSDMYLMYLSITKNYTPSVFG